MLFLILQKERKRRVCLDPTPSDNLSDWDTDLTVPFADGSMEEEEEEDTDCEICTGRFSEDRNVEEWLRCVKYFRWAHTLWFGTEEDFVCEPCQGKTLFCVSFVFVIF